MVATGDPTATYYDSYWGGDGPLTGLYPALRELLEPYVRPSSQCLDVGCGDGRTAGVFLARHAASYTGVDVSPAAIDRARTLGLDARVIGDPATLPFPDDTFDLATCFEVLEHLVMPNDAAVEIRRVLRPGGLLIATVPNVVYWRRRLDFALVGRWNPLGDQQSLAQPWRDPHLRFFNLKALKRLLESVGYDIEAAGGHWGGLLVDVPGRQRFGRPAEDANSARRASSLYRTVERRFPSLLGFRLHVVARG
jgi:SAM-dependent methyltransferase